MRVTFWGVRGSVPTPHPQTLRYGGNTPCVEIRTPAGHTIILDCGTGIIRLGNVLVEKTPPAGLQLAVFLSHFHWDHIQGLPFFAPLYDARNQVVFHSFRDPQGVSAKEALDRIMLPPYFPIDVNGMKSHRVFRAIREERLEVFDTEIVSRWLHHPQGCLGFRVESETGVFVYATDHEHGDPRFDANVCELAEGADLLVYDAQYTPDEYQARVGWGHSTWEEGVRVARDASVNQLVLFHHDPGHFDLFLDRMLLETCARFPRVEVATEGTTVSVQQRRTIPRRVPQRIPVAAAGRPRLQRVVSA